MKTKLVKVNEVRVGKRFREEFGEMEALAASIKEKGVVQPIAVDGSLNLLAGGRRLRACEIAGLETIPAIILDIDEGELSQREIELIENTLRKDLKWQELAALEERIFELRKKENPKWTERDHAELMGHSQSTTHRRLQLASVSRAIPELAACETEDKAWKTFSRIQEDMALRQLEKTIDRVDDPSKWATENYKLGDAVEGLTKVSAGVMHLAEVDPPYGIGLDERKSRNIDTSPMARYNELSGEDYVGLIERASAQVFRILRSNAFCIWWFGMTWYQVTIDVLRDAGFKVNDTPAIWYKGKAGQTATPDTMLGSCYEPFFIARKGKPKMRRSGRGNVFDYPALPPTRKIHPTEKPLELMVDILDTFSYPGFVIVSPFLGSGVTLRAAYRLSLTGFGFDLDEVTRLRFIGRVKEDREGELPLN